MKIEHALAIAVAVLLLSACRPGTATPSRVPNATSAVTVPLPPRGTLGQAPPQGATPSATPKETVTPTRGSTITVSGSVKFTGTIAPCTFFLPATCSGKSEFYNLPAPDDFQIVLNRDGKVISGKADINVHSIWHYTSSRNDCTGKHDSDGSIGFTGAAAQAEGGDVKITGKTKWDQAFTAEGTCPKGGLSLAPQMAGLFDDSFTLEGLPLSSDMTKEIGDAGKCKLGFLDQGGLKKMYPSYECAWTIESVK